MTKRTKNLEKKTHLNINISYKKWGCFKYDNWNQFNKRDLKEEQNNTTTPNCFNNSLQINRLSFKKQSIFFT